MSKGFIFSGQGAQKVGMGKSLAEQSALAQEIYAQADAILGWSIREYSFEGPESTLTETRVCQPALFVHGYVLYRLLEEAGAVKDASLAMGLSLGELTALTVAGAFDFETGLRVVAERGKLMQEACDATSGAMASIIGGSPEAVQALAEAHDVDLGNLNCPGQIVLSGDTDRIAAAVEAAKASGDFKMVVPLKVAGAYHSRLMRPASEAFAKFLENVEINVPKMPVLSNVLGEPLTSAAEIRDALTRQVYSSVQWELCMRNAASRGITTFFELGPGGVLSGLARRIDRSLSVTSISEYTDLSIG